MKPNLLQLPNICIGIKSTTFVFELYCSRSIKLANEDISLNLFGLFIGHKLMCRLRLHRDKT